MVRIVFAGAMLMLFGSVMAAGSESGLPSQLTAKVVLGAVGFVGTVVTAALGSFLPGIFSQWRMEKIRTDLMERARSHKDLKSVFDYEPFIPGTGIEVAIEQALKGFSEKKFGVSVLLSPPDYGKSERARLVAARMGSTVFCGVVRIDFKDFYRPDPKSSQSATKNVMSMILRALGDQAGDFTNVEDMLAPRAHQEAKPLLVILDNIQGFDADDMKTFRKSIQAMALSSVDDKRVVYLALTSNQTYAEEILLANGGLKTRAVMSGEKMLKTFQLTDDEVNQFIKDQTSPVVMGKQALQEFTKSCKIAGVGYCREWVLEAGSDADIKKWKAAAQHTQNQLKTMSLFEERAQARKDKEWATEEIEAEERLKYC